MNNSKQCFKCGEVKPLSLFYKHKRMADGHLNKCIECAKKDEKKRQILNADYIREYERGRANLPHRIEARKRYSQTEEGKKAARKAKQAWLDKNTIKRAAHILIRNAIKKGEIKRELNCQSCGKENCKPHAHHDDYALPLSIRWLCSKCHIKWHKENGEGKNG